MPPQAIWNRLSVDVPTEGIDHKVDLKVSSGSLLSPESNKESSVFGDSKPASLAKIFISESSPTNSTSTIAFSPPLDDEIPDGGWRAWLVVLGSFCCILATFGYVNSWGVFQSYYQETLLPEASPSLIAWIGSMQYALSFVPALVTGRLFDLGHFKLSITIASLLLVLATFLVAECTELWHFMLCQGFTTGLACGFIFGPTATVLTHWFKKKRATALAISTMGSSVGGTLFPVMFRNLVPIVGFRWTMRIIGFTVLFFLTIGLLAVRRRLPPAAARGGLIDIGVFKNTAFCLYTVTTFVGFFGVFTILTYVDVSATAVHIPANVGTYLVAIANAASAAGRLGSGVLADRFGPLTIMIPATLLTGIVAFAWPFATTEGSMIAVAIFDGAGVGAFVALLMAPVMAMGSTDDVGRRVGMFMTILSLGALAGPPISGAIYRATDNFFAVGMYAGAVAMVCVALMVVTRFVALEGWRGKV